MLTALVLPNIKICSTIYILKSISNYWYGINPARILCTILLSLLLLHRDCLFSLPNLRLMYNYLIHYKLMRGNGGGRLLQDLDTKITPELIVKIENAIAKQKREDVYIINVCPLESENNKGEASHFLVTNKTTKTTHRFDYRSEAESFYDDNVNLNGTLYEYEMSVVIKSHSPPEIIRNPEG